MFQTFHLLLFLKVVFKAFFSYCDWKHISLTNAVSNNYNPLLHFVLYLEVERTLFVRSVIPNTASSLIYMELCQDGLFSCQKIFKICSHFFVIRSSAFFGEFFRSWNRSCAFSYLVLRKHTLMPKLIWLLIIKIDCNGWFWKKAQAIFNDLF